LSAIAAARLKAEAKAKGIVTPEITIEPVPEPVATLPQSPVLEPEEPESDEEPLVVRQNEKLCNWRNEAQNIVSDTESELTVKLTKHTTIALVGCFHFKVVRGAININGANIGALSRDGQKDQIYTSYAPATHPVAKIRGLDGSNHVQFTSCTGTRPFASTSPLFADIWNVPTGAGSSRSFSVVSTSSC
jgi:polynucleotide 5'-hydroxyl-kinase GRC3/NOL9